MKKSKFTLWDDFDHRLSYDEFKKAKKKYLEMLVFDKLPNLPENAYDLVEVLKRKRFELGPYIELSIFEAINRIASDLVVLAAGNYLFQDKSIKEIEFRLSTKQGYDLLIYYDNGAISCGEAANTSPEFGKGKVRSIIEQFLGTKEKKGIHQLSHFKTKFIFLNKSMQAATDTDLIYGSLKVKGVENVEILFVETQNLE